MGKILSQAKYPAKLVRFCATLTVQRMHTDACARLRSKKKGGFRPLLMIAVYSLSVACFG
jgi:hypothetical protein